MPIKWTLRQGKVQIFDLDLTCLRRTRFVAQVAAGAGLTFVVRMQDMSELITKVDCKRKVHQLFCLPDSTEKIKDYLRRVLRRK